jgi:cation transport ATPase
VAAENSWTARWREYGSDALIVTFTFATILVYLLLRFACQAHALDVWPLYIALMAGGVPLPVRLVRQGFQLELGSDWLAGISMITAVLLHEYLVASIVVLMLSGGSALEHYATRRASSALSALAKRMPTTAHRVTGSSSEAVNAQQIVSGDLLAVFPHEICPVDGDVIGDAVRRLRLPPALERCHQPGSH